GLLLEERDQARRSTRGRRPPETAPLASEAPSTPRSERPAAVAPVRPPAPPPPPRTRPAPVAHRVEDLTVNPPAELAPELAPSGWAWAEPEGEFNFSHLL